MLRKHARQLRAFTLLELVVVLMILAALAGLVISQVAQLGRTTDMAYSAKTSSDIAENLQMHFVLQKRYPTNMDSLLVGDSANPGAVPTGVYVPDDADSDGNQDTGLPDSGPHLDRALVAGQLTNGGHRSFRRSGFDTLVDHVRGADNTANSNESATIVRAISNAATDFFALVDTTTTNSDAQRILRQVYPSTLGVAGAGLYSLPDDVEALVAVGIGPRNSAVPETMLNAPIYPGNDGSYYGHYVAIFACFRSGERAVLVGVCDSYGRLNRYAIEQFNESLPNKQRRG